MTIATLSKCRSDEAYILFWKKVELSCQSLDIEEPTLPMKRKLPKKFGDVSVLFQKLTKSCYDVMLLDPSHGYPYHQNLCIFLLGCAGVDSVLSIVWNSEAVRISEALIV